MKLSNKLRGLTERLESRASGHTNGPISHAKAKVYLSIKMDLEPLLADADRLESQNRRLRELLREAYAESWGELSPDEYREEYWEKSLAKAALDALDKEGTDEAR